MREWKSKFAEVLLSQLLDGLEILEAVFDECFDVLKQAKGSEEFKDFRVLAEVFALGCIKRWLRASFPGLLLFLRWFPL